MAQCVYKVLGKNGDVLSIKGKAAFKAHLVLNPVDTHYANAVEGEMSIDDYGKHLGLSQDDTDGLMGIKPTAERTEYGKMIDNVRAAIESDKAKIIKPTNQQAAVQKAYQAKVNKFNLMQDTLNAAEREHADPFTSIITNYVPLSPAMHKRFAKQFAAIQTGDVAKAATRRSERKAMVDLYKSVASINGNVPVNNDNVPVNNDLGEQSTFPRFKRESDGKAIKADLLRQVDAAIKSATHDIPKNNIEGLVHDRMIAKDTLTDKIGYKILTDLNGATFKLLDNKPTLLAFKDKLTKSTAYNKPSTSTRGVDVPPPFNPPNTLIRDSFEDGEMANAWHAAQLASKPLMYGRNGKGDPIAYFDTSPVDNIDWQRPVFVGKSFYGGKFEWSAIDQDSGVRLGDRATTREKAIANAVANMKKVFTPRPGDKNTYDENRDWYAAKLDIRGVSQATLESAFKAQHGITDETSTDTPPPSNDNGNRPDSGTIDAVGVPTGQQGVHDGGTSGTGAVEVRPGGADVERNDSTASKGDALPAVDGTVGGLEADGGFERPERGDVGFDMGVPSVTVNYDLTDSPTIKLTPGQRKALNTQAEAILAKPIDELTPVDRDILRQYTGTGGLNLKDIKDAGAGIFNQHFTSYDTIKAMYAALSNSGVKMQRALEPSAGSGNFIGLMPTLDWTAVDIDRTNTEIVRRLYPQADTHHQSYELFDGKNFDLIISNVPFASASSLRREHQLTVQPDFKAIHNFFFAHSVDKLNTGGVMAFMTSTGTMDGTTEARALRKKLMESMDVIGAYRLPAGTQKANASTDVSIDVIFLQKRPVGVPTRQQMVNDSFIQVTEYEGHKINKYLLDTEGAIMGKLSVGKIATAMGVEGLVVTGTPDYSKMTIDPQDYGAVEQVEQTEGFLTKEALRAYATTRDLIISDETTPFYSALDNRIYDTPFTLQNSDYVGLLGRVATGINADKMQALLNIETTLSQDMVEAYRAQYKVAPIADKQLAKWAKSVNGARDLKSLSALFDKDFKLSQIFTDEVRFRDSGKLVVTADSPLRDRAEAAEDADGIIADSGLTDAQIKSLLDDGTYARLSGHAIQNSHLYYAGNIYTKLDGLFKVDDKEQRAMQYAKLMAVRPPLIGLDKITIRGDESWVPKELKILLGVSTDKDGRVIVGNELFEDRAELELYTRYLNHEALAKFKDNATVEEKIEGLKAAQQILTNVVIPQIKTASINAGLSDTIVDAYNRSRNFFTTPTFDGSSLKNLPKTFRGQPFTLMQHQLQGAERAIYNKKGVLAFAPGLGKTPTAIVVADQLLQKGVMKKPLFIVPANTVNQWIETARSLYPDRKVFEFPRNSKGDIKDWAALTAAEKETMAHDMANNRYDFTFISSNMAADFTAPIEELGILIDKLVSSISKLEELPVNATKSQKKAAETKKAKLAMLKHGMMAKFEPMAKAGFSLDKLGFDAIFADEAQNYKNIGIAAENSKGNLGASVSLTTKTVQDATGKDVVTGVTLGSQRSYNFRFLSQYISERNNGNNVFLLSGTPTPNKPLELLTLLNHLDTKILEEYGISSVDEFINEFLSVSSNEVMGIDGKPKMTDQLTGISNVQGLKTIIRRFVDYIPPSEAKDLTRPEQIDIVHDIMQSEDTADVFRDIQSRLMQAIDDQKAIKSGATIPDAEVVIQMYTAGRDASIDLRLYTPTIKSQVLGQGTLMDREDRAEYSKIATTIKLVTEQAKADLTAGQLIFLDRLKFPAGGSTHAELRERIMADSGLSTKQVAFVNGQEYVNPKTGNIVKGSLSAAKLTEIMDAYNAGDIKVLIGSRSKMGVGVDLQVHTTDVYMIDKPYRPDEIEQAIARAVRQGNRHASVRVHQFNQIGSFDDLSNRILEAKKGFNEVFWRDQSEGDVALEVSDVPSAFDAAIEIETDPIKKAELIKKRDEERAEQRKEGIKQQITNLARSIKQLDRIINENETANKGIDNRTEPAYESMSPEERTEKLVEYRQRMAEQRAKNTVRINHATTQKQQAETDLAERKGQLSGAPVTELNNGGLYYSFAGVKARSANDNAHQAAIEMLAEPDVDADLIRKVTGWYKGADDKLRFEISDHAATLTDKGLDGAFGRVSTTPLALDKVIDHPALFTAYPELNDINVVFDPNLKYAGSYNNTSKTITLRNRIPNPLSVILHEVQHAIQRIEGFATGGNSANFKDDTDLAGLTASEKYNRLAGEVEARNTQARMDMTPAERNGTSPNDTADYAPNDQIISYKPTTALSDNNHTTASLLQSMQKEMGTKWSGELLESGKFKIVTNSEAAQIVGEKLYQKNGSPQGFYSPVDKTTYLVADNIPTGDKVKPLLLHEVAVHALQLGKDKPAFKLILDDIGDMFDHGNKPVIDAVLHALNGFGISGFPSLGMGESVNRNTYSTGDLLSAKSNFKKFCNSIGVVDSPSVRGIMTSISNQHGTNATRSASKYLSNMLIATPGIAHDFHTVDVDTKKMVFKLMGVIADDTKVFNSIVHLIPVDMMNMLIRGQFSPHMDGHQVSMLIDLFSERSAVSKSEDSPFGMLVRGFARLGAKDITIGSIMLGLSPSNSDISEESLKHEVLAYLVQHNPELSAVKNFMAWFKFQIRKLGITIPFNANDLIYMAHAALSKAPDTLNRIERERRVNARFEQPRELRTNEWKALARKNGIKDERILDVLAPKEELDSVTGFHGAHDKKPTVERALKYVTHNGNTAHFVDADIANLGGLNSHFGNNHELSNAVYKEISDIFADEMQRAGDGAVMMRHGGDEISSVVFGGTDKSIRRAKEQAFSRILDAMEAKGLHLLPHGKKKEDLTPYGVGLYMGSSPIKEGMDTSEIFAKAAKELDAGKHGGLVRSLDFAANALNELAKVDNIFRHPISQSTNLVQVMRDVAPTLRFHHSTPMPNGVEQFAFVTPQRKWLHVYTSGDNVWIEKGDGGGAVYAAVGNYAHNAGKVFIADPKSMTADGTIRRTSHMLSLALRFGTTDFMQPSSSQLSGIPALDVEPLKWGNDTLANVKNLIHSFSATFNKQFPEAAGVHYDFDKQEFVGNISKLMEDAGDASARRGVVIESLLSGDRPDVLEDMLGDTKNMDAMFSRANITNESISRPIRVVKAISKDTLFKPNEDGEQVPFYTAQDARDSIARNPKLIGTHEPVLIETPSVKGFGIEPIMQRTNNNVADTLRNMVATGDVTPVAHDETPYLHNPGVETVTPRDEIWTNARNKRNTPPINNDTGASAVQNVQTGRPTTAARSTRPTLNNPTIPPRANQTILSNIRDVFAPVDGKKPLNYLGGFFQRDHLIDFADHQLPTLDAYKSLSADKDAMINKAYREVDNHYNVMLTAMTPAQAAALARVQGLATRARFDPENEIPNNAEQISITNEFNALSQGAKDAYVMQRDDFRRDLETKQAELITRISAFPTDPVSRAKVIAEIEQHFDMFLKTGVYFPLARFGDTVVTAKKFDAAGNELTDERTVSFVDGHKAADMLIKELREQGYTKTWVTQRAEFDKTAAANDAAKNIAAMASNAIGVNMSQAQRDTLLAEFNQELINALPDSSYRKHFVHRKGTLGYTADGLRAYASTRNAAAKNIASLRYDHQIAKTLTDADKAIAQMDNGDHTDTQAIRGILNELKAREKVLRETEISQVSQVMTSLGFMGALGFNIASAGVNLMQVPGVAFPELVGKYGSKPAFDALNGAYRLLFNKKVLDRESGFNLLEHPSVKANPMLEKALKQMGDTGIIDMTLSHDAVGMGENPSYADTPISRAVATTAKWAGYMFHVAEAVNRQIVAVATFNLAYKKNGGDYDAAVAAAIDTIHRTQFNYGAGNRSRYMMGNAVRVATLFKTYAISMAYFIGRNAHMALAKLPSEERSAARKTIVAQMAMTFATSGLFGLPIGMEAFAAFGGVTAFKRYGSKGALPGALLGMALFQALLWGMGEDDDDDVETDFRNWLTDNFNQTVAEVMTKGISRLLPIGDISDRLGLHNMFWSPENKQLEGKDKYNSIANMLLGPLGGQAAGIFTAKKMFDDGEYHRAVESMTPAALRNLLAAYRMGVDGVKSVKGDDLLGRDLRADELFAKMIGFNPTAISNTYAANSAVTKQRDKLTMAKSHLLNRYAGEDASGRVALLKGAIADYNKEAPVGMQLTTKTLLQSLRARLAADKHTKHGLYLGKKQDELRSAGRFNQD